MNESPIFTKMYDLLLWATPLTAKFPREQRFILALRLQTALFMAYETLIRAGRASEGSMALPHLDEVGTQLAFARFYFRMGHAQGYVTLKQFEFVSERITEVGRLLQAWQQKLKAT